MWLGQTRNRKIRMKEKKMEWKIKPNPRRKTNNQKYKKSVHKDMRDESREARAGKLRNQGNQTKTKQQAHNKLEQHAHHLSQFCCWGQVNSDVMSHPKKGTITTFTFAQAKSKASRVAESGSSSSASRRTTKSLKKENNGENLNLAQLFMDHNKTWGGRILWWPVKYAAHIPGWWTRDFNSLPPNVMTKAKMNEALIPQSVVGYSDFN